MLLDRQSSSLSFEEISVESMLLKIVKYELIQKPPHPPVRMRGFEIEVFGLVEVLVLNGF